MINLEKAKPFLIGAGILGVGYFVLKYAQGNQPVDNGPESSENYTSGFTLPTPSSGIGDGNISTYPTVGLAAPITVTNTPTYLTYNYGDPNNVAASTTYQPVDTSSQLDSCCNDCATDSCDTNSINNNPYDIVNSIPKSTIDAQVANAYSKNLGTPTSYLDNYDATPVDSYQGVLGNGATNSTHSNHIVNQYTVDPVVE